MSLLTAEPIVKVASARFVTIELAAAMTGYSASAIRTKIARGVWVEGREWVHADDNRILVDMKGYEAWAGRAWA